MKTEKDLIVITGAAGGIGMAAARTFKNNNLIITDYSQKQVDETLKILRNEGFDVYGIPCDITNKSDVAKLIKFVSSHGNFKALIHTAGVSGTVTDLKKVFTIDLVATELLLDSFYELAVQGSVAVLLSSMMAHTVPVNEVYDKALSNPQEEQSFEIVSRFLNNNSDQMYNFAKRGVLLLSYKNAEKWGAKGGRIVTVSPGVIETEMAMTAAREHPEQMEQIKKATPLKRNGTPEDVADVIHFLASDAARFITATDILVDGGVLQNIKKILPASKK